MENAWGSDREGTVLSVTCTVKVDVPGVAGVPLI
jgi:hypothetical protein